MLHMGDDFSRRDADGRLPENQSGSPDYETGTELGRNWEAEAADSSRMDAYEHGKLEPEDL